MKRNDFNQYVRTQYDRELSVDDIEKALKRIEKFSSDIPWFDPYYGIYLISWLEFLDLNSGNTLKISDPIMIRQMFDSTKMDEDKYAFIALNMDPVKTINTAVDKICLLLKFMEEEEKEAI